MLSSPLRRVGPHAAWHAGSSSPMYASGLDDDANGESLWSVVHQHHADEITRHVEGVTGVEGGGEDGGHVSG